MIGVSPALRTLKKGLFNDLNSSGVGIRKVRNVCVEIRTCISDRQGRPEYYCYCSLGKSPPLLPAMTFPFCMQYILYKCPFFKKNKMYITIHTYILYEFHSENVDQDSNIV